MAGRCPRAWAGAASLGATERLRRDLDRPARVPVPNETLQATTGPAEREPFSEDERRRRTAIDETATKIIGMPSPA